MEESEVNFVELVHSLLEDPSERKYFFQVRWLSLFNVLIYLSLSSVGSNRYFLMQQKQVILDEYGLNMVNTTKGTLYTWY